MGRGKALSDTERIKIFTLKETGQRPSEIARLIGRSRHAVIEALKYRNRRRKNNYKPNHTKISKVQIRSLYRVASNSTGSSRKFKEDLNLPINPRQVRRYLKKCPHLKYKKMKCKPPLTQHHKANRLGWCQQATGWDNHMEEWRRIVWSDEKKFNLDGPDGWAYYWHDITKEEVLFSKRQSGGGSVMVWGAYSCYGKMPLVFIEETMNAERYLEVLENNLIPYLDLFPNVPLTFMQDNASVHSSKLISNWMDQWQLRILGNWPSKSPDLNPIENLWGILARKVYANCKQYANKDELKAAIIDAWNSIEQDTLEALVASMPRRLRSVIDANGNSTKY